MNLPNFDDGSGISDWIEEMDNEYSPSFVRIWDITHVAMRVGFVEENAVEEGMNWVWAVLDKEGILCGMGCEADKELAQVKAHEKLKEMMCLKSCLLSCGQGEA